MTVAGSLGASAAPLPAPTASLEQNHPNPFNPSTEISFRLDQAGPVQLDIHDAAGRLVQRLAEGVLAAGRHSITWQPRGMASGTYFYNLKTANGTLTRKCVLLK